jgi:hypothetical protein
VVEDIEVSHSTLLFQASQTAEVGRGRTSAAPATACGRVGRIDKAMQPWMRGLLRNSVFFFENIAVNDRP